MSNTRYLTRSALAIGLIVTSFTLFRYTTNILNAFLIPLILAVLLYNHSNKQKYITYITVYITVLILYPTQFMFMLVYIGLAQYLSTLMNNKSIMIWIIRIFIFAFILLFSTFVTDKMFMLKINFILFNIARENYVFFILFYLVESSLILIFLSTILKLIYKLLKLA